MRRLLLIPLLAAVVALTAAQPPEPSPAMVEHLSTLEIATTDMRGLSMDTPVTRVFPLREDVVAFVGGQLDDPETLQYYIDLGRAYKAFDLLPADIDIVEVLGDLLISQIGGYYDPETKTMNTLLISGDELTDRLPLLEQIVYVHEFTHALQDANFDLTTFLGGEDDLTYSAQNPDEALARLALIEGDATEVMTQYVLRLSERDPMALMNEMEALMGLAATLDIPAGTPKILEQELIFPYTQGQVFVAALLAAGGWEMVNEAYTTNPPASSEQIIDPARWINGDMPQTVDVDDVADLLGDGWTQLYNRTAGEFFLRRFLETQLTSITVARAAGGWGGDSYRLYINDDSEQSAWVWRLAWDSPEDADQFYAAMVSFIEKKYPPQLPEFSACWSEGNSADTMCLGRAEGGDVVITRAPQRQQAMQMRDAVASVFMPA